MLAALAALIALATLALVITRPRGLNEGVAALVGGVCVVVFGLVPVSEIVRVEARSWNVYLFFLGMMGAAAIADQSGVFDAVASALTVFARGRIAVLYLAVFALGAAISILFANDTAALVLTPIVYALVVRLSLDPLPFVFATTFIADTASIALPVSNPLNVVVVDAFHIDLGAYVHHLWLPALLVIILNVAAFFVIFRRSLTGRFRYRPQRRGTSGLPSTLVLLLLLAIAYLVASAFTFPLGMVAVAGAGLMALNLVRLGTLQPARLVHDIGWPIFGFIGGMLAVVQALHDAGITAALGRALVSATGGPPLTAIGAVVVGTAVGSNLINNLPMALVTVSTVKSLHLASAQQLHVVYSTIIGCDLGPNLTHLGSLATFIWLFFLRRKGVDVSTWDYFRIGLMVTPLMLAAAILGLWVTSGAHV